MKLKGRHGTVATLKSGKLHVFLLIPCSFVVSPFDSNMKGILQPMMYQKVDHFTYNQKCTEQRNN